MNDTDDTRAIDMLPDVANLLTSLVPTIDDDYRASIDDDEPSMDVTIASDDGVEWTYQTGDNSYSGSCYHYQFWGVGTLYRDSDATELAEDLIGQMFDQLIEHESWNEAQS